YASRYPADDTVTAELAAANVADVEEAIETADAARRRPDWANLKPHERAAVLYRVAALIRERAEELAQLQRRDNGKPITEPRALGGSGGGAVPVFARAGGAAGGEFPPAAGRLPHEERPRADGRHRRDHAVELADRERGAEARACARRRQRGRRQARRSDAA